MVLVQVQPLLASPVQRQGSAQHRPRVVCLAPRLRQPEAAVCLAPRRLRRRRLRSVDLARLRRHPRLVHLLRRPVVCSVHPRRLLRRAVDCLAPRRRLRPAAVCSALRHRRPAVPSVADFSVPRSPRAVDFSAPPRRPELLLVADCLVRRLRRRRRAAVCLARLRRRVVDCLALPHPPLEVAFSAQGGLEPRSRRWVRSYLSALSLPLRPLRTGHHFSLRSSRWRRRNKPKRRDLCSVRCKAQPLVPRRRHSQCVR